MSAMKKCSSSFDRLGDLPSNITENILMFLPMQDMVRTSVLAKKWRFRWVQVPELIFENDSKMFQSPKEKNTDNLNIVFGVLLQHHGPIRKFKLDMSSWNSCNGVGKIFHFLSRNGIQELSLLMSREEFRMPPSIYSCVELTHLSLKWCSVKRLTLVGLNKLVTLELVKVKFDCAVTICHCPCLQYLILRPLLILVLVTIDAPNLKSLVLGGDFTRISIKKSPLLKDLSLACGAYSFIVEKKSNLIECLSSLPLLENLCLSGDWFKLKSISRASPNELPTMLSKLQMLRLTRVDLNMEDQLSFVLRLIRSSPNLQKLEFTGSGSANQLQPHLKSQTLDVAGYSLIKLREVKFELKNDWRSYLEFVKFLLAVSPELETLYIKPVSGHIDLSCCKCFLKLACTSRASPKANIVFIGLDLDS